jgi:hypothetical protein
MRDGIFYQSARDLERQVHPLVEVEHDRVHTVQTIHQWPERGRDSSEGAKRAIGV